MRPMIIVMSHGNMAKETIRSAQMIVGTMENVFEVSMSESEGLRGVQEKLTNILATVTRQTEVVILADLKGGTPCNVALTMMKDYEHLQIVSGLNLAMLIEAVFSSTKTAEALANELTLIGRQAIEKIEMITVDDDEGFEE